MDDLNYIESAKQLDLAKKAFKKQMDAERKALLKREQSVRAREDSLRDGFIMSLEKKAREIAQREEVLNNKDEILATKNRIINFSLNAVKKTIGRGSSLPNQLQETGEFLCIINGIYKSVDDLLNVEYRQSAVQYFEGDVFTKHCDVLGLSADVITEFLIKGGYLEKTKKKIQPEQTPNS